MPLIQLSDNEFLIILLSLQFFNSIASAVIIDKDLSKYKCILSIESRSLHGEITKYSSALYAVIANSL